MLHPLPIAAETEDIVADFVDEVVDEVEEMAGREGHGSRKLLTKVL